VWPYWSVDLPGLSEANVQRVLAWAARENVSLGGSAIDPAGWFTSHIDRATAESLRDGLCTALDSGFLGEEQRSIITRFAETLDEWLVNAAD
jgi:hypothetical protein